MPRRSAGKPLPQPHKRPSQARAVFTVNTLYEGFVRIWRRDGPDAATTRAIAEESGYAVGRVEQLQDGMVHVKLDGQQQDRIGAAP